MAFVFSPDGMVKLSENTFSVAQHSLLVENIFAKQFPQMDNPSKLFALLHDSAEYVIGDMISPLKSHLGNTYEELDEKLTRAICIRFNIPTKKIKNNQKTRQVSRQKGCLVGSYTSCRVFKKGG